MITAVMTKTQEKLVALLADPTRVMTHEELAQFLVDKFNGFTSIFDNEQRKKGHLFGTIHFRKEMNMRATMPGENGKRFAKDSNGKNIPNPFLLDGKKVWERGKMTINLNSIYENTVANKQVRTGAEPSDFEANKERANKIQNWRGSRVVCVRPDLKRLYVNYYDAKYHTDTIYEDDNGNLLDYADLEIYHNKKSYESKEKQATRQGLTVETMVEPRQMKFDSIEMISIFGEKITLR